MGYKPDWDQNENPRKKARRERERRERHRPTPGPLESIIIILGVVYLWWALNGGHFVHQNTKSSATQSTAGTPREPELTDAQRAAYLSQTFQLFAPVIDRATGKVVINGVDSSQPTIPFVFEWGDGTSTIGFFPQEKVYQSANRSYNIRVTATHADGSHPSVTTSVDLR
jgi:hypothetical protein